MDEHTEAALLDLCNRVQDWKGVNVHQWGHLLSYDQVTVIHDGSLGRPRSPRRYKAYLFEKGAMFCREKPLHKRSATKKRPGATDNPSVLKLRGRLWFDCFPVLPSSDADGFVLEAVIKDHITSTTKTATIVFDDKDTFEKWVEHIASTRGDGPGLNTPAESTPSQESVVQDDSYLQMYAGPNASLPARL